MASAESEIKQSPSEDTGVTDVRRVREKIAGQYHGDLRKHAADTDRIVEPLIRALGLTVGVSAPADDPRSGMEG